MNKDLHIRNSTVDFLTFAAQNEGNSIEVRFEDDTLWLTQQLMADLFQSSRTNIVEHIRNIYRDQELTESATCRNFRQVRLEGNREVSRELPYYNLDMIIAVGYRVNSKRATEFRQWATAVLRNYAIRGYVIDRKRMENGTFLNQDYFEHLLAEIREIRISERRFYQKITDIYATSIDYNPNAPTTKEFFAKVQNKLHYAVHGRTAAELIVERADSTKEHMGLTTWENAPNGKIVKTDVSIAKNYLKESELEDLGRIVNAYLDLAERRAKRHIPMTMADWALHLDRILVADDMELLKDAGKISAEIAKEHAENEFEKYRVVQDRLFRSDFDKQLELFDAEKDDANKE
ncbi:MAG: virulence RhuM family protein [Lentisphaeria bacterium]|nr:virulence RhuM family protein [Lentisphaeria bacterium]